ncbi:unnamed protein product [Durusdinium trenchii]|uniref:Uncharacterized protein n=1 Tax=Durusdinium trenchii TaxID=1381693 RepID=A0ABP0PA43_9DINO
MLGLAMESEEGPGCFLDVKAFPHFSELLSASEGYARHSGCRFRKGSFSNLPEGDTVLEDRDAAKARAAPAVKEFMEKVEGQTDQALCCELNEAFNILWSESMRSAMVARCQQLDLWPPNPPPEGIDNADCDCSKDTSSIVAMAQRLYNQAQKRDASYTRLLSTASFLADFAYEAGLPTPQFFLTRDPVTEKFETMADEYERTLISPPNNRKRTWWLPWNMTLGLGI